jgi:hypothetical protein
VEPVIDEEGLAGRVLAAVERLVESIRELPRLD